ncbi:hypothetical protein PA905_39430 [Planktothrix agardhii CCAP 1459/11A]|uniref:Uncharacterized protein n=1 Tax=Planktothrix agardhii CCAP 1459/11A TaxID=282420 RepID=A0A4P5ZJD2_PLAAG|nr:hypothetical protein [Planktothrix agardhii]GDZ95513.1 hypothetical protein PA905_39430 [Planktothrix agardhii CCAP 1459/11A]
MIEKVYAPNLHLFAFHLYKVLRNDGNNRVENPQKLFDKCYQILEKLRFSERLNLAQYDDEVSEKSKNSLIKIYGKLPNSEIPIAGRIYPQCLHDSYAVAFNLRRPEQENGKKTEEISLDFFLEINPDLIFLPEFVDSSLGQTLLITAFIPEEFKQSSIEDLEILAQKCLEELIPNNQQRPPLQNQGEVFGSPIFEYDNLSQINLDSSDIHYCHILIWLFTENQSSEDFIDCYSEFIDLFFYRNKVITAYQQSLKQYEKAFNYYGKIEGEIKSLNEFLNQEITDESFLNEADLKFLKQKLKALSHQDFTYSQTLRNLKHYRNTIGINSKNYKQTLKTIQRKLKEKSPINSEQKLDFFLAFINEDSQYFQERIKDELNYFVEGSTLVDRAIASIRGITEIEQTENQRGHEERDKENNYDLQITILAVGTGMSAGGITGSSSGLLLNQYATDYPVITFGISLTLSFIVALLSYLFIFGIGKIFKNKKT